MSVTTFKGITHIGNDQLMNILETNLKQWYDWGLLKVGAWSDITLSQSGAWGGDFSQLRLVNDSYYTDGQVWEGVRKDWVWETGVDYTDVDGSGQNPLTVGTPTIDGVAATGAYHVNYPLGRIIFDTPVSTSSTVKVQHAYRNVQVYRADDAPWFRQLQFRTFRPDDSHVTQSGSGEWAIGGNHRVQLPTIILEAAPRGTSSPYELGNGSLIMKQDVLFHILAESRSMRNNLVDIIRQQSDKSIWLYDNNTVNAASAYPLDYRGELTGSNMYPDLIDEDIGYRWNRCFFANSVVSEVESIHPSLHEGIVRTTAEIVLGGS
jgi:hypothetical protein